MANPLPADVRRLVAERAGYCCEYCLVPEAVSFAPHQVDHIIAVKHGGRSVLANLAYSCAPCNRRKGSNIAGLDEAEGRVVPLFHPREDDWWVHFRLDGPRIVPLTAQGRVTTGLLQPNRSELLDQRERLLRLGLLIPSRIDAEE